MDLWIKTFVIFILKYLKFRNSNIKMMMFLHDKQFPKASQCFDSDIRKVSEALK